MGIERARGMYDRCGERCMAWWVRSGVTVHGRCGVRECSCTREKKEQRTYITGLESGGRTANLLLTLSTSRGGAVETRRATLTVTSTGSTSGAGSGLGLLQGCWHDVVREVQVSGKGKV